MQNIDFPNGVIFPFNPEKRAKALARLESIRRSVCPPPVENSNALAVTAPAADGQGADTLNAPPSKPSRKPTLSLPPKRPTPSNFDFFPEAVPSPKTRKTFVLAPLLGALSPSRAVGNDGSLLPLSAV